MDAVNNILKSIQNLNENIMKSEVYGDSALELRDQRNMMLDSLSQYMKIDVTYTPVSIGAGKTVDKLVVKTSGDSPVTLVDGSYSGSLTMGDGLQKNPDYDPKAEATGTNLPYLDADGNPTDIEADAAKLPYALTISALTNRGGEVLVSNKETQSANPYDTEADAQAAIDLLKTQDAAKGTVTDYTYQAVEKDGKFYISTTAKTSSAEVTFSDTELHGSLQSTRELLTECGEFATKSMAAADTDATTKRGIPYYQTALDALARKFAQVMNAANSGYLYNSSGNYVDANGTELSFTNADGTTTVLSNTATLTDDQKTYLADNGQALGGVLFSNRSDGNDTDGITAANLSISSDWAADASLLQNSFQVLEGAGTVGSSDNQNILHILAQFDGDQKYTPDDMGGANLVNGGKNMFTGSFEEMFTNIEETLAQDTKSTTTLLNNYSSSATELDVSRESVSGVDLNDEAMNMMQFQKSYSAACRLMTTLDEVLDKLINGTGSSGR